MAMPEAMVIGCNETNAGGIDPASAERLIELGADCDAVLIGPGMTDPDAVAELTRAMLKHLDGPALVLDALAFSTLRADAVPPGPYRQDHRDAAFGRDGEISRRSS